MKKTIIIGVISLLVIIAGIITIIELSSYRTVNVSVKGEGYSVEILNNEDAVINTLTETGSLRLKEGSYGYKTIGEQYSDTVTYFTVDRNNTSILIDPSYSDEYFERVLQEESPQIQQIITTSYPFVNGSYIINNLTLHKKGEWLTGELITVVDRRDDPDIYRFVMKKENNVWNFIVSPRIAIDKNSAASVPEDILYSLYSAD